MARIGKIARLPEAVRSQLNSRLQDNVEGKQIVQWLNSLPEVQKVLAKNFDGRPINEQNLTDWRQGGYEEWLARQDILAQAAELAASHRELQDVAPGHSFTDHLADVVAFRYAAILASQGLVLDEPSLRQLHALDHTCQAVVKLRRSDQNAARLQIETERWERAREQLDDERAETVKCCQRKELAAPIWQAMRKAERRQEPGGDEATRTAVDLLDEIENCPDPAHFQSQVLASLDLAELRGDLQEPAKEPSKRGHPSSQTQSKPRRRSSKPAGRRSARIPRASRPVHPVQPVHTVHPTEAALFDPAPLAPDSGLSATSPSGGEQPPIKPDQP
jgi:hypothetical protein